MPTNVQDRSLDEINVIQTPNEQGNLADRHVFQTIDQIAGRGGQNEWKQRAVAIAIALVICTVLYGVLYLAMHFQH